MSLQKITIENFLELSAQYPVLDVRSPAEYAHAHIPNAINIPLFSDEERKIVGTAYKQKSREEAIKIGLDFFGVKMRKMVEEVEDIIKNYELKINNSTCNIQHSKYVIVHCWRGGMRSAGVAWLLDLYGFKVYTLVGGYKAYRKWVLSQFEKTYNFTIIGGYTGSGKTLLLLELQKQEKAIINLEALANHKGSAFGALGQIVQPKQEMFENMLAKALSGQQHSMNIYIEDESQRIGNLQIPMPLWNTMRKSSIYFLDIPFEERLNYLTEEYGQFEKEKLVNAIIRIQKRLGGLETKNAINHLLENNYKESFRILLTYYDKWYNKALQSRENISSLLKKIYCTAIDREANAEKVLACNNVPV